MVFLPGMENISCKKPKERKGGQCIWAALRSDACKTSSILPSDGHSWGKGGWTKHPEKYQVTLPSGLSECLLETREILFAETETSHLLGPRSRMLEVRGALDWWMSLNASTWGKGRQLLCELVGSSPSTPHSLQEMTVVHEWSHESHRHSGLGESSWDSAALPLNFISDFALAPVFELWSLDKLRWRWRHQTGERRRPLPTPARSLSPFFPLQLPVL